METVAQYCPSVDRLDTSTEAVMFAAVVPEEGERDSQPEPCEYVIDELQLSMALEDEKLSVWFAGFAPPTVAL